MNTPTPPRRRRYQQVTLEFYRALTGKRVDSLSELPDDALRLLMDMPYEDKLHPLLVDALRGGASPSALAEYYGINRMRLHRIKERYAIT
jgi:hypothetical protein